MDNMSESNLVKCSCCDKTLPASQVELSFRKPDVIAALSSEELESRCKQLWEDGFSLDDERYFIRALIPMSVHGSDEEYCLGAWAEISADDYRMVLNDWEKEIASPSQLIRGHIANQLPYTKNSLGSLVDILATDNKSRPILILTDENCSLTKEQQQGIARHRAAEFTNAFRNQERWTVIEEDEFDPIECSCCGEKIQRLCGRIENEFGEADADYWLRIPEGHKGKYTIAVSLSNGGEVRVASIYGELREDRLIYWIQGRDDAPWLDFGDYGNVMERDEVLNDLYKSLFFDVVDTVAFQDSRLLSHINRENHSQH